MARLPPSSSGSIYRFPTPIYAFEKNQGTISSTFICRLIHRVPVLLKLRDDGGIIDAVRYGGRYWPTYKPETFPEKVKQWVSEGDTIYGPNYEKLKLPLEHPYLFDCDAPRGVYGW